MSAAWMDVIGIGEDGVEGLSATAKAVLEQEAHAASDF